MASRVMRALLGLWLFCSGFLWPHIHAQSLNASVVGMLVASAAIAEVRSSRGGRLLSASLGTWLVVSGIGFSATSDPTFWNHAFVGVALILCGRREVLAPGS